MTLFTYQVAAGHNNEAGYANLSPQPRCPGVFYAAWTQTPDGASEPEGRPYAELIFEALDEDAYSSLLTQFGLASANYALITITLPGADRAADNWNGVISIPERPQFFNFYQDVRFMVRRLEAT